MIPPTSIRTKMRSRSNRDVSFDRRRKEVDMTGDDQKRACPVVEQRWTSAVKRGPFNPMFDAFAVDKRSQ